MYSQLDDATNPILTYQWTCIKKRIKYESQLNALQNKKVSTINDLYVLR